MVIPSPFRRFGSLLVQAVDKCQRDNTPMLAAGLSFYTMLSLAPALWIVVAITGAIIGHDAAHDAVFDWMSSNVGANAAEYLSGIVHQVRESSGLATLGGAIAMFLGSTAAFGALQNSLNQIWHQPGPSEIGMLAAVKGFTRGFLTRRLLAFLIMLLLGVLILVSLLAGAVLTFLARSFSANLPAPTLLLATADLVVSISLTTLLFGALFHLLHKQALSRSGIWMGSSLTAVLLVLGKALIGLYLGGAGLRSAYGAAGSLVLLLLWIYYSAQILLFGAEFTEVYCRTSGGREEADT